MVVAAIDSLAHLLTGQPYYFMGLGTTANEGAIREEEEKLARERGGEGRRYDKALEDDGRKETERPIKTP
jgi:hypothetical protein